MYEDAMKKEGLQRRRHVSYSLGRRHPYLRGSEKYRKIYLPYSKHLGKCPLLILF
ncbi:unnamed protein product [Prunus brigantina]